MSEPVWITREECVTVHELLLAQFGGLVGIRDEGLLLSALDRPKNLYAYQKPTFAEMAASLASGIILNHPFCDGNKRTGFLLAAIFIESNGHQFLASEESALEKTLALAAREIDEKEYADWLFKNMK
jgi:death-on-curing protein